MDLLTLIKKSFALKEVDIRTYSPLTLAYIGDAVYDLIFRTMVVQKGNTSVNKLHNQTIQYVKSAGAGGFGGENSGQAFAGGIRRV